MQALLDTHTLIWCSPTIRGCRLWRRSSSPIPRTRSSSAQPAPGKISTKHRIGKLRGCADLVAKYSGIIDAEGFVSLRIDHRQALRAGSYPFAHQDPFDRMLAAQSELLSAPLLTNDGALRDFPCRILW